MSRLDRALREEAEDLEYFDDDFYEEDICSYCGGFVVQTYDADEECSCFECGTCGEVEYEWG